VVHTSTRLELSNESSTYNVSGEYIPPLHSSARSDSGGGDFGCCFAVVVRRAEAREVEVVETGVDRGQTVVDAKKVYLMCRVRGREGVFSAYSFSFFNTARLMRILPP